MKSSLGRELVRVARANFLPALGLQCVAAFLLCSYYFWPAAHAALNQLAYWKQNSGYVFSFFASVFAGALLPYVMQGLQRGDHRRIVRGALPFVILFWGLRGCFVDFFYQLQAALWGDNARPLTIAVKIWFDLGVASPLLLIPSVTIMFAAVDSGFNLARFRATFHSGVLQWWVREVWPLLRVAWIVWLPAVAMIYALPAGLQFPTQAIIQCLWSLILVVITDQKTNTHSTTPQTAV
jgi:hypothetical protein